MPYRLSISSEYNFWGQVSVVYSPSHNVMLSIYIMTTALVLSVALFDFFNWFLSVYFAEAAPNHSCKCKEQEWEVPPTTPGRRTWRSLGCLTSHWSIPCPSWCAIQFDLIHIFKRTCPELVRPFSRACFSWWKAEEAYCRWCQKTFVKEKMRSNIVLGSSRARASDECFYGLFWK